MKIRNSIILLLIMIISNAVFAQEMYSYTYQNTPEKDSITEAFLGDILAKQSYGIYVDCIIPKINFQKRALRSDFLFEKILQFANVQPVRKDIILTTGQQK